MIIDIDIMKIPEIKMPDGNTQSISFSKLVKQVDPYEIIVNSCTIQSIISMMYQQMNTEFPAILIMPSELSFTEALTMVEVNAWFSICGDVRFMVKDGYIKALQLKHLKPEALQAYLKLLEENKIDDCIKTLFNKKSGDTNHENVKVLEFKNENPSPNNETVKLLLQNKFFLYLANQIKRNGGAFGFPFLGWTKVVDEVRDEIEQLLKSK